MSVPGGLTAPEPTFAGAEVEVSWKDSETQYFRLGIKPNGDVSLCTPTGVVRDRNRGWDEVPAWMMAALVELRICKDKFEALLRSRP